MIPWPELPAPPPTGGGDADAAVVVAIEDYAFLPDVPGARANGRAWAAWLKRTRGVPRVRTLTDAQATREAVSSAITEARRQRRAGGVVWVVFIGHGAPGGQLLGADAQATALSLTHRRLDGDALLDGRTVAILDACHADRAAPSGLQPVVPGWLDDPPPASAPTPTAVARPAPPRPRHRPTVLVASGPEQAAGPLPGRDRPAFSYLVLGALRGWGDADQDGIVTAAEAVAYADGVLSDELTDRVQSPVLRGPDRALGRGEEAAPTPPPPPPEPAPPLAANPAPRPVAAPPPRPRQPLGRPRLRIRVPRPGGERQRLPWLRRAGGEAKEASTGTAGLLVAVIATAGALLGLAVRSRRA